MQNIILIVGQRFLLMRIYLLQTNQLPNNCRNLRRAKIIDSCYSRDGIICIKNTVNSEPEKNASYERAPGRLSRLRFFK